MTSLPCSSVNTRDANFPSVPLTLPLQGPVPKICKSLEGPLGGGRGEHLGALTTGGESTGVLEGEWAQCQESSSYVRSGLPVG